MSEQKEVSKQVIVIGEPEKSEFPNKTCEYSMKMLEEKKKRDNRNPINVIIKDIEGIDFKNVYGGELIKIGNYVTEDKAPKFSINDTVETIPEYESDCCPYVKGVITSIEYSFGSIVYLIGDTWIYEKWLRKVII